MDPILPPCFLKASIDQPKFEEQQGPLGCRLKIAEKMQAQLVCAAYTQSCDMHYSSKCVARHLVVLRGQRSSSRWAANWGN